MVQRCMDGHGQRNHGQLDVVFGFTQIHTKIMGNSIWYQCNVDLHRDAAVLDINGCIFYTWESVMHGAG